MQSHKKKISRKSFVPKKDPLGETAKSGYIRQSETKRPLNIFNKLQKDSENTKSLSDNQDRDDYQKVLIMSSIGQLA